jgi:hypothetical protein
MTRRRSDPPFRYEWERVVKAVILPSTTKHVALNLATYADGDGRDVFPGNERLTDDTGLSDKTVRTALDRLRAVGLIERVSIGSRAGRRGLADVYRLTIPDDLLERVLLVSQAHRSPVAGTGDPEPNTGSSYRRSEPEHRYLTTGTPVTDAGTPVTDAPITGNSYRTPVHDQPKYQPIDHLRDSPTDVRHDRAHASANGHKRPREDTR